MCDIKFTYFNITGLGEPIRLILTYAGINFEDFRLDKETWTALKPLTPFGKAPIYEENGKIGHQSKAIARYVAKKAKLVGDNDWEDLEIDAIVDTFNDLMLKIAYNYHEQDPAIKAAQKALLDSETVPFYLDKLDAIAKENNGHLALKKLTWADFYFSGVLGYYNTMYGAVLTENRPNLAAVAENVFSIPSIKAWLETHPQNILFSF